jgi:hypothetical protein
MFLTAAMPASNALAKKSRGGVDASVMSILNYTTIQPRCQTPFNPQGPYPLETPVKIALGLPYRMCGSFIGVKMAVRPTRNITFQKISGK